MKSQELRIGNYVLDSGGKVLRIDFFEHLQSGYDCKFGQRMFIDGAEVHPLTEYTNSAKPIPLTEQWLLDFGFVGNGQGLFDKYTGHLNFWQFTIYASKTGMVLRQPVSIKVYQVHQLQNLYFALTGEELQL